MARISIFADESGNFDFSRKTGASRYFIIATVTMRDLSVGDAIMKLRRELRAIEFDEPNVPDREELDEQIVWWGGRGGPPARRGSATRRAQRRPWSGSRVTVRSAA